MLGRRLFRSDDHAWWQVCYRQCWGQPHLWGAVGQQRPMLGCERERPDNAPEANAGIGTSAPGIPTLVGCGQMPASNAGARTEAARRHRRVVGSRASVPGMDTLAGYGQTEASYAGETTITARRHRWVVGSRASALAVDTLAGCGQATPSSAGGGLVSARQRRRVASSKPLAPGPTTPVESGRAVRSHVGEETRTVRQLHRRSQVPPHPEIHRTARSVLPGPLGTSLRRAWDQLLAHFGHGATSGPPDVLTLLGKKNWARPLSNSHRPVVRSSNSLHYAQGTHSIDGGGASVLNPAVYCPRDSALPGG